MRLIVDTLIVLLVLAVAAGVLLYLSDQEDESARLVQVQDALMRLHERMTYEKALGSVPRNRFGYPATMAIEWFGDAPPRNVLAPEAHPWLDVAPGGDMDEHPPDPVIESIRQAGIWYNPNRGLFRARVPRQISDRKTLDLYNEVNRTFLESLPLRVDEARQPILPPPIPGIDGPDNDAEQRATTLMDLSKEMEEPD